MKKFFMLAIGLFCVSLVWAQSRAVSGTVSNEAGDPINSASVVVVGSQIGTVTDENGRFTLSVPNQYSRLEVSSLGYNAVQVNIVTGDLRITLSEGSGRTLDDIVVVGYGTRIRKDLTGNIAQVKGTEVANTPVTNINQALQGRAAGVFVESLSGRVGEGVKVRIRGAGSISASNSPLYVVDGIPINQEDLTDLNLNDIESFDILKDASAAAIYGSRAANGVILITTKKGRAGGTRLNVNAQYGFNKPTSHREFLNTAQYIELFREAAINSDQIEGIDPLDPADYRGSWLEFVENRFTRYSGHTNWRNQETNTNWEKLAYNDKSATKILDVNASGGNDRTRFYASGNYTDLDGIMIKNNFERISGRLNLEHDASARVKIGVNMGLSRTITNRITADNGFQTPLQLTALAPITPVYDQNGNLSTTPVTTYYNGLLEVDEVKRSSVLLRNLGNAFLKYKIIDGLVFNTEFGLDYANSSGQYYASPKALTGQGINGYGESEWGRSINYNTNNYFNYRQLFGAKHDLDATVGMSFQKYTSESAWVTGQDFPVNELNRLASAGEITGGSSSGSASSFLSYFARANYKFDDKYLLTLSGRVDGSSRFGRDTRYGVFPAVSAGWILSEESFLSGSSTLSFLKLRGSWGLTGNAEGFGNFSHLGLWGASKYNNSSGLTTSQLANPLLAWEKSEQTDIGLDFGLFNNRLTGEIDYYVRQTRDLIYNVPVPGTTGFSSQTVNIGAMKNNGFEFVLNSANVTSKDFKWNTSLNLSKNRNQITQLDGDQDKLPGNDGRYLNSMIVGEAIGVFYGPKYAGVDPENGDALYYTEDGKTTTNDYNDAGDFIVGNPNPSWIGGLNNTFSFKGFDLSILFQGVYGNSIMNGAGGFMSASADWFDNQTVDQLRRWQKPGDVTDVPQARIGYGNGIAASSRYIYDGSYVRLKNLTFGYNLPKSVLGNLKMQSARIYIAAVNLLTFTDYPGWDPEVNSDYRAGNRNQGGDFYTPPQVKSVTFGLNLGF